RHPEILFQEIRRCGRRRAGERRHSECCGERETGESAHGDLAAMVWLERCRAMVGLGKRNAARPRHSFRGRGVPATHSSVAAIRLAFAARPLSRLVANIGQKKPSPGWSGEGKLGSTMVLQ